jgi:hypothetical protein
MTETPEPAEPAETPTDATTGDDAKIWDPKRLALRWFAYGHLAEDLQEIAHPISDLADALYDALGEGAEKSAGFRKLLEAKDCFVRAAIDDRPEILRP